MFSLDTLRSKGRFLSASSGVTWLCKLCNQSCTKPGLYSEWQFRHSWVSLLMRGVEAPAREAGFAAPTVSTKIAQATPARCKDESDCIRNNAGKFFMVCPS